MPRAAYRLRTERLALRCYSPLDAPRMRELLDASDQHLRPWIPWMSEEPRSLEATAEWLRQRRARFDRDEDYRYAILTPDEAVLIGEAMLAARVGDGAREIGYLIDVRQGGQGYATEAAAAMLRLAFEVEKVERVEIHCSPDNAPSAAIPLKLGFHHEATLARRFVDSEGQPSDTMVWTMFTETYPGSYATRTALEAFDVLDRSIALGVS